MFACSVVGSNVKPVELDVLRFGEASRTSTEIICVASTSNYNAKAVGSVRGAFGNAAHIASRLCTKLKPQGFVTKIRSSEAPLG